MPTFFGFHSLCRSTEDDLKRAQEKPRDEYGVKGLNAFCNIESRMEFCLVDAPDRDGVEKYHAKFGIKCGQITEVKMTETFCIYN